MKIHGLCLVKNEADVIEEVLRKASLWCDYIYVMDNGSDDGTWETVLQLAGEFPGIKPFLQTDEPYSNALRSRIFNHYRKEAQAGDWWCRLDADEIYIDDPRCFLDQVPRLYQVVWGLQHQFYFTDRDLTDYETSPTASKSSRSIEERLRYYRCDYSEIRFFRHRERLRWETGHWPRHLGLSYPKRIRLKHFQFRSPEQIQKRLEVRTQALARGCDTLSHYRNLTEWRKAIRTASELHYLEPEGELDSRPEINNPRHLEPPPRRVAKALLHASGIFP